MKRSGAGRVRQVKVAGLGNGYLTDLVHGILEHNSQSRSDNHH